MAIQHLLKSIVDRKEWEQLTPAPVISQSGSYVCTSPYSIQFDTLFVSDYSNVFLYDHYQDSWTKLPASGIAGTFGAGACGVYVHKGPNNIKATGGSLTTLQTNLTINKDLRGYELVVTWGPSKGDSRIIHHNTLGPNSIITVVEPFSESITSDSYYDLNTGRFYCINPGASGIGFSYYDVALNTWTARSVNGLTNFSGDSSKLIYTDPRIVYDSGLVSEISGGSTLTDSSKSWTVDSLKNKAVQIISGSGIAQERDILANSGTVITIDTSWLEPIDTTSRYVVISRDYLIHFVLATSMYVYSLYSNSWTALSSGRGGVSGQGGTADWIVGIDDPSWKDSSNLLNGRYIYSFRGDNSSTLDVYDVVNQSWSTKTYYPQSELFNLGSSSCFDGKYIYILKDNSNRIFRFNPLENRLTPFSTLPFYTTSAAGGAKLWIKKLVDGGKERQWLYYLQGNSNNLFRCLIIDN